MVELGAGIILFAIGSVVVVRRVLELMKERANARLGHAGERAVAEELQPLMAQGYYVYHDVPLCSNRQTGNIDHIAVGPHGLVVIETKTRSRSTKEHAPKQEVTFDGGRLIWPYFADDRAAVRQVKRCAEWAGKLAAEVCGRDVPVQQIIAIPGWAVNPGKSYNPRVVPGGGVAQAFAVIAEQKPRVLRDAEIQRIAARLDALCRDAEW